MKPVETHTEAETERRREAALQRMFATPHKPHKANSANPSLPKKAPKPGRSPRS